ncbi:MAG TPA: methyltransferase domain-containing protein [Pyrinomonadaceae bacterium]|jgi:ubiquinone/menaquinone biosynthesis C-methylase UbiE
MSKTQKELAFLRDLYIDAEWTLRFTDLADKHLKFSKKEKKFLYINAGTGNHALALRQTIGKDTEMFATAEDKDILTIARDKAVAVRAKVDFSMNRFADETFDAVLADASFVRPDDLQNFLVEAVRVTETGGKVAVLTVTAGSFGEIFSFLWEIFFNNGLGDHGVAAEKLITEIPTVWQVEELAQAAGLKNIASETENQIFEYENGAEFVNSTLVADFLLPVWLKFLNKKEKAQVSKKLAQLVDDEDRDLSFRFSVKATLVTGERA